MFLYQFIFFWLLLVIWLILALAAIVLLIFGLFLRRNFFKREVRTFAFAKFASVRTCEYPSGLADLNDLDKKGKSDKKR